MNLTQLRTFTALARHGNYTRAAEELYLSQPSVYLQVRALEHEYGQRLVEQVGRKATLTNPGRLLLRYAEAILALVDEARRALDDSRASEVEGGVLIGTGPFIVAYILPPLLHAYKQLYPLVELRTRIYLYPEDVDQRLLNRDIDLALHSGPPQRGGLVGEVFHVDPMVAVVPPAHPLAGRKAVSLQELAEYPFIHSDESAQIPPFPREWLVAKGVSTKAVLQAPNEICACGVVKQGMGMAILSQSVVATDVAAGYLKIVPVDGLDLSRQLYVVWRREQWLSRPVRAMLDLLRNPAIVGRALAQHRSPSMG